MSYDLSFDAKSVVFSARLTGDDNYQLFSMNLDGTNLQQLTSGRQRLRLSDLPAGRADPVHDQPQRRGDATPARRSSRTSTSAPTTAQVGTINIDGTER